MIGGVAQTKGEAGVIEDGLLWRRAPRAAGPGVMPFAQMVTRGLGRAEPDLHPSDVRGVVPSRATDYDCSRTCAASKIG